MRPCTASKKKIEEGKQSESRVLKSSEEVQKIKNMNNNHMQNMN